MKKIFIATVVICFFTLMYSCKSSSSSASSPTTALKAMATDSKEGDFKAIAKHMCKKDREVMEKMIPMIESMAKMMGKDLKETMKEQMAKNDQFNFNDVSFSNEKVNGDKATVDVFNKKENKTQTIEFAKEDGSWKICMGIMDKANAEMQKSADNDPNAPKNMDELMEKMNDPKIQEEMKKAQEMMKNMKPEDMEKMKKAMENLKPN